MPWTPPPGGVEDEHRYSPGPAWYGSRLGTGRNNELAEVLRCRR